MGTAEWFSEIYDLIINSEVENREALLIRWGIIATKLDIEVEFRDN